MPVKMPSEMSNIQSSANIFIKDWRQRAPKSGILQAPEDQDRPQPDVLSK
jgi:hypothetical protein